MARRRKTAEPEAIPPERLPYRSGQWKAPDPESIRWLLEEMEITQGEAAKLVGINDRSFRRYVTGERDIPYSSWVLLLMYYGLYIDRPVRREARGQHNQ